MYKHLSITLLSVLVIPALGQFTLTRNFVANTAQHDLSICIDNCLDDRGSGRNTVALPSLLNTDLSACTENCGERGGGRRDQQYKTTDQEESLTKKRGSGRIDPDPNKLSTS